jgi:4-hydroxy-3-methylbut-2-en-1-yl diphosphate reductase
MESTYFRRGFGLKAEIEGRLTADYHSAVVERLRANQYELTAGPLTFRLAKEFGFCYGVERAVDYAYETRHKFPDRRLYLVGEIIHNPHVNQKLSDMGVRFLARSEDGQFDFSPILPEGVVILPAFGVTVGDFDRLRTLGCVLVDTTCGSVLNVWKRVDNYARDGFTAVIHGKHYHEETKATASQALTHSGGHYLCVRDKDEAAMVCAFLRGEGTAAEVLSRFAHAASPGFDPDRDLQRIGLANQTTMLMSESLEIQEMLRAAMRDRWGQEALAGRFRAFDTICSATQDRQDAVLRMLDEGGLSLMVVIGGYNSSNTQALTRICAEKLPTYHINEPACLRQDGLRHRLVGAHEDLLAADWLPSGPVIIGLTAGASTPNNVVGEVVVRLLALRGLGPEALQPA